MGCSAAAAAHTPRSAPTMMPFFLSGHADLAREDVILDYLCLCFCALLHFKSRFQRRGRGWNTERSKGQAPAPAGGAMQSEPQHHATQPAGAPLAPPVMQAPHVQSHFAVRQECSRAGQRQSTCWPGPEPDTRNALRRQSPSPHVPPQVPHYMMSPPTHLKSMMSPPAHQSNVRGMAAASPQVDCWGMQGWIVNPCAAAAQGLTAAAQGYAPVQPQNFQTAAQRCASMHPALPAYEALLVRELGHLQGCCSAFGEPLTAYGQAIGVAMNAQRDMIAKALAMRRPESAEGMRSLLAPTEAALTHLELLKTRSCDDRADLKNHLQMLCGACSALGWVTTTDPKAYVRSATMCWPCFFLSESELTGPAVPAVTL